ncbi:MAG: hypothetical protein WCO80_10155 [Betaproteobacteria bacterium]|jgi:hypothetical protein|nr:hypothetical protein [Betaproteobacteria bacterium]NBT67675.1 hypothetical protein [Betaproteobacteria bacterium]NBY08685.1 hypothetical protein [Betaproteobacteria bacterium]
MLNKWWPIQNTQTVMGHRIEEPHLTGMAFLWGLLYLGLPLLLLGMAIDGVIQITTGHCTGWWCWL